MGRLMDAALAVSVLAMASAVVWADWVISCCRVDSEAMFQILNGQIMVRSAKQEEDTKMAVSRKPSFQLSLNLNKMFLGGALPIGVVVGSATALASVPQCCNNAHMHSGGAFWVLDSHFMFILYKYGFRKGKYQGKILPLAFPYALHMVVQSCITVIQFLPSLCTKKC